MHVKRLVTFAVSASEANALTDSLSDSIQLKSDSETLSTSG